MKNTKTDKDIFGNLFKQNEKRVIRYRRALHQIPERGLEEVKTSAYIRKELKQAGISFTPNVAVTGIVGRVTGKASGPGLLIRADFDGLAVPDEDTGLSYRSKHPGFMHACGHDAHAAMLLTTGIILKRLGNKLPGRVILAFQPAEEGGGGGGLMVKSGKIDFKKLDAALALHVWGAIPAGKFGWNVGPSFAMADGFEAEFIGRGGHGSAPAQTADPIPAAVQAVSAINSIVGRKISIHDDAVISVCAINGGTAFNIIPEKVHIKGTVRTYKKALRENIVRELRQIITQTAAAGGVKARFTYHRSYPALFNDEEIARLGADTAEGIFGKKNVLEMKPTMGGEDFSYFLQKVPGAMLRLGSSPTKKATPHHNPKFDIDESVLIKGVEFLCRFTMDFMKRKAGV